MSADSPDDPRATAIHRLEQFGLSRYAARTFVALSTLGVGTARDVSRIAEVPRTRV
jgi:sugar-specific transcriptional regulator TrmB